MFFGALVFDTNWNGLSNHFILRILHKQVFKKRVIKYQVQFAKKKRTKIDLLRNLFL